MATFRITAPDGRKVKVSGDRMPTEGEMNDIFASLPAAEGGRFENVQNYNPSESDNPLVRYPQLAAQGGINGAIEIGNLFKDNDVTDMAAQLTGSKTVANALKSIAGEEKKFINPRSAGERAVELGAQRAVGSLPFVPMFGPAAIADSAAGGALRGAVNPKSELAGFLLELAGASGKGSVRGLLSKSDKPIKTGLSNFLADDEAVSAVSRGVQDSKEVAKQIGRESPEAFSKLNSEAQKALENAAGRKLDIKQSINNQQKNINEFIAENADFKLFDTAPEATRYKGGNSTEVLKSIRRNMEKTDPEFSMAKTPDGAIDYPHFISDREREQYIRTLPNTYKNPDAVVPGVNQGEAREYLLKKYYNPESGKHVYDVGVKSSDGTLINKFAREGNKGKKYYDKLEMGQTSQSAETARGVGQAGHIPSQQRRADISLSSTNDVVNSNLPRLEELRSGLTDAQKEYLDKALAAGSKRSFHKLGSLDAAHKAQEVLNDMIESSYDTSIIGQKKATSTTRDLMGVKSKLNDMMEPSGIKPHDSSYSKAKSLESFRERGYKFNPSEEKFENLGIKTLRDRQAFLQGRMTKIFDNVRDEKSLAKAIINDENTLKKLMPEAKFNQLMDVATDNNIQFDRLRKIDSDASAKLVKPAAREAPYREKWESLGAVIGAAADKISSFGLKKRGVDLARAYLDGNVDLIARRGAVGRGAKSGVNSMSRQALIDALQENDKK